MNILDIIIILVVAMAMICIAVGAIKRKRSGKPAFPCNGNCEGCGMCGSCRSKDNSVMKKRAEESAEETGR